MDYLIEKLLAANLFTREIGKIGWPQNFGFVGLALSVRFGSVRYLSVRRSRPTGDLFFASPKKQDKKASPCMGVQKFRARC